MANVNYFHAHTQKRTRANTLANKRFVTSAYKSIMNHRHVIFVAFECSMSENMLIFITTLRCLIRQFGRFVLD